MTQEIRIHPSGVLSDNRVFRQYAGVHEWQFDSGLTIISITRVTWVGPYDPAVITRIGEHILDLGIKVQATSDVVHLARHQQWTVIMLFD